MSSPAQRWSALHHGIDPAGVPLLSGWLRLMWAIAGRLRAVPPTALTALGVALAAGAVWLAADRPALAAAAVLLAAFCDGLDGAVAVVADRATAFGARADAAADRVVDVAFAAVLWRCGAPLGVATACATLAVAVDLVRRVRHVPARITVGERPTWTICAALTAASSAVTDERWPVGVCAAVWVAAGLTGVGQLLAAPRAARRN